MLLSGPWQAPVPGAAGHRVMASGAGGSVPGVLLVEVPAGTCEHSPAAVERAGSPRIVDEMSRGAAVTMPGKAHGDACAPAQEELPAQREPTGGAGGEEQVHVRPSVAGAEGALDRPVPGEPAGDHVILGRRFVAPHDGAAAFDELPREQGVLPAAQPQGAVEAQTESLDLTDVEQEVPGGRCLQRGAGGPLGPAE